MTISENVVQQKQAAPADDNMVNRRLQSIRLLTITVSTLTVVGTISFIVLYFYIRAWQVITVAGMFALATSMNIVAASKFQTAKRMTMGLNIVGLGLGITTLSISILLTGLGIPAAVVYLIFSLIASSVTPNDRQANVAIATGVFTPIVTALAADYSPYLLTINLVNTLTPAIVGILFMLYVTMLANQFVAATLRIRLVTAFIAVVVVPLAILSAIQGQFMLTTVNNQVNEALTLASKQTASGLDNFISDIQEGVVEAGRMDVFTRFLELPADKRKGSSIEQEMRLTLQVLDTQTTTSNIYLSSFALLDENGINVYDTLHDRVVKRLSLQTLQSMAVDLETSLPKEGSDEGGEDYFQTPARTGVLYASPIEVQNSTRAFFYISVPIKNQRGHVLGVLRARFDGMMLQDLLKQYNGLLADKSYAILVDENNIRLADAFTPNNIYKSVAPLSDHQVATLKANRRLPNLPANMISTNLTEFDDLLKDYENHPVFTTKFSILYGDDQHSEIGAITKMRTQPWRVVYLRADYSDAEIRRTQSRLTIEITTIIAGLIGMIAVGVSQLLSNPITRLTRTAQKISQGDLEARAPAQTNDEFGMLGAAFNLMTRELRSLINQLEDRVRARTQEIESQNLVLEDRARQMQTVAEVARQIVSAQELETLFSSITHLISERFGFYHVGIFLVDESHEYAVLRAANSEGGQRMLARRHMLPVGKVGMVGYATGVGVPRIATDVGADAVYFNNPDLPNTRSEMALPLKVGDQVIGALDIQSTESNAFNEDDIELFNTLADQVAIAIYNNTLFTETREALEEAKNVHRKYLQGEWVEDTAHRKVLGYLFNQSGISAQQAENPLWKKVFSSGEPVYAVLPSSNGAPDKAVMAVPIAVRGETIGVIHVQDQGDERLWSEDEIAVVNSIANQVAVALENARLFENTVRRAEREKKVLQITAKIRSTNDPEEMMRIAVSELQQALHASRTQIYIRQEETESKPEHSDGSSNGTNGSGGSRSSAEK